MGLTVLVYLPAVLQCLSFFMFCIMPMFVLAMFQLFHHSMHPHCHFPTFYILYHSS